MRRFVLLFAVASPLVVTVACQSQDDGCGSGCYSGSPHGIIEGHPAGTQKFPATTSLTGDFLVDGIGNASVTADVTKIIIRTAVPEGCRRPADGDADTAVDGDAGADADVGPDAEVDDGGIEGDAADGGATASNPDAANVDDTAPSILIEHVEIILPLPPKSPYEPGHALDLQQLGAYARLLEPGTCATMRVALTGTLENFNATDGAATYGDAYTYDIKAVSVPAARRNIRIQGSVTYRGPYTRSYPAQQDRINCY